MINPDYNMIKPLCIIRIYNKRRSKFPPNRATSPTCHHCDVKHLFLTTGVTYPVVKDPRARGTSLGTCKGVASQCRKSDLLLSNYFGSINRFKHNHHVPCRHWHQDGGWHAVSLVTLGVAAFCRGNHNNTIPYISVTKLYAFGQENCVSFSWYFGTKYIYIYTFVINVTSASST